jgi:hypothetical protein
MRNAILPVALLSLSLAAAAIAETMGPGQRFNQPQQPYQQQQMQQQPYQPQYDQQQMQQQQYQQQQMQQQPYQQQMPPSYQQPPSSPPYQPPPQVLPAAGGSQPGGPCAVKLSADRSTILLMDPDGTERKHVPLGQDRVQKVFTSPDGAWSLAVYKIRGAPQYGFIAVDLAKCEEQTPVDLPSIASSASFGQGEVVLSLEKGERRFKLENPPTR